MLTEQEKNNIENIVNQSMKQVRSSFKSLMHPVFNEYSSIYTFTTENLGGYIKKLNLKNKKVLTVTASLDHMLNLVLNGVKEIDNFDINKNTYYFAGLKMAAMKVLSYDEFLNFFSGCEDRRAEALVHRRLNENPYVLDYNVYKKIKPYLKEDCAYYWDLMYKEFNYNGKDMEENFCLSGDKRSSIYNNEYLNNEENYNKTRANLESVAANFYATDILQLHNLTSKYDCILCSNIYDYLVSDWYNVISAEDFNTYVNEKLSNILNDKGVIALSYQYHYKTKNRLYKPALLDLFKGGKYVLDKREKLDQICFKKILIPSFIKEYRKNNEKDCLYLYGKNK